MTEPGVDLSRSAIYLRSAVCLLGRYPALAGVDLDVAGGLAVALARRPRLRLLDEHHAGLDATGRDLLDGLLRASADEGRTVLLVSHELDRARALAGREVTLVAGAIRPVASADDERQALP